MVDTVEDTCREKQLQKPQMSQASLRQQRNRRGNTLIKKAYELSDIADADVFLGIRLRDGRVRTFCADKTGFWSSKMSYLDSYYPIPQRKTPSDFVSRQDGIMKESHRSKGGKTDEKEEGFQIDPASLVTNVS
ncbi:hypothetical protein TMatcc_002523 [Talaromyces marneffei ATCC 18224]|uniref:uncharacterized protein n=1 Tax=Talaromyces marneffei TaxID=37727 RepID=UPI0012A968DF|nr:uncharacterized protein EYB26_006339 [Talaromyces marneffei]QGA18654.1 hypothetical protein EYB26_006339 [Talaromyces marneffei]